MGKGGGCVPSKKKKFSSSSAADRSRGDRPSTPPAPTDTSSDSDSDEVAGGGNVTDRGVAASEVSTAKNLKQVFIVYYSMYGHVEGLARRMKKGVDGVGGVEGVLYRVPETLSQDVLEKMKAPPKEDSVPEIKAKELVEADGVLFGFPTRYGCMEAQMKAFFDSTGGLWKEQKLAGKPAGFFVSTGTICLAFVQIWLTAIGYKLHPV